MGGATPPLLHDIAFLFQEVTSLVIRHIYCKANSIADWVVLFVAQHLDDVFCTTLDFTLDHLEIFFLIL